MKIKEAFGNYWDFKTDAYVITTNGFVKKDGSLVMGRGIAREADNRFPGLAHIWGGRLRGLRTSFKDDNWLGIFLDEETADFPMVFFPVKYNWWEPADIGLIATSAWDLALLTDWEGWTNVNLPRPGCGNGQLEWDDVKPVLEEVLNDRFTAVTFE